MLREYAYNAQTGALDGIVGRWETNTSGFQDATYPRDAVGNVTTTITDNVTATATRECFLYDTRNRLVRAHTAAPGIACLTSETAAPLASGSRGVDAYDTRWMFDSINRIDKRIDMLPGGAGTLDHQYDSGHPHAVTGMTEPATTMRPTSTGVQPASRPIVDWGIA